MMNSNGISTFEKGPEITSCDKFINNPSVMTKNMVEG